MTTSETTAASAKKNLDIFGLCSRRVQIEDLTQLADYFAFPGRRDVLRQRHAVYINSQRERTALCRGHGAGQGLAGEQRAFIHDVLPVKGAGLGAYLALRRAVRRHDVGERAVDTEYGKGCLQSLVIRPPGQRAQKLHGGPWSDGVGIGASRAAAKRDRGHINAEVLELLPLQMQSVGQGALAVPGRDQQRESAGVQIMTDLER